MYAGEISFSSKPPKLILICGPCRVGTTALANTFASAGIEAHMQPIKSARRAQQNGGKVAPWRIGSGAFAVVKETLGPKAGAEFFDPVEILLRLGYPKENLVLIPILRDPRQAWASWKRMWGGVEFPQFVRSYEYTRYVKERTERRQIPTFPYIHEVIREISPDLVIERLFRRLGIHPWRLLPGYRFTRGWGRLKQAKNVFFYDDPPERFISGIEERGQYEYRDLPFGEEEESMVASAPALGMIYEAFRESCLRTFGTLFAEDPHLLPPGW